MNLYITTFFGLYPSGDEAFKKTKYFSSKTRAMDQLRKWTNEDMQREHSFITDNVLLKKDLFTHIALYEEREGQYIFMSSHPYSTLMADGEYKCWEGESPILESL